MSAEDYLDKADHGIASAKILLAHNEFGGAANRAYYAMFDAARAALYSVGESGAGTHKSIISQFGLRFVRDGPLSPTFGRSINDAQLLRIKSDYGPSPPDPNAVRTMVAEAEAFVTAVRAIIPPDRPRP